MAPGVVGRHYVANARRYDLLMRPFAPLRVRAIASLDVRPGDRVLELGCGTGTSFPLLVRHLEPAGHLIGVDRSAAMLAYANQKRIRAGWHQVSLVQGDAEELAVMTEMVDAVLIFYANDIITSAQAIEGLVQTLRPGGQCVIAGVKLARPPWGAILNRMTRMYVGKSSAQPILAQPWHELERQIGPLAIEEYLGGTAFIACGLKRRSAG